MRPFLRETTPIIRNEIRPFARDRARPVARAARRRPRPRAEATPQPDQHVRGRQLAAQHARLQPARRARRATCSGPRGSTTRAPRSSAPRTRTAPIRARPRSLVELLRSLDGARQQIGTTTPHLQVLIEPAQRADASRARSAPRRRRPARRPHGRCHSRRRPQARRRSQVIKQAPSIGRIVAMIAFALSCFGILLYLWLTFGGSMPLKPQGYRVHGRLPRGHHAGPGGRRAHLRRAGRARSRPKELDGQRARDVDARDRAQVRADPG